MPVYSSDVWCRFAVRSSRSINKIIFQLSFDERIETGLDLELLTFHTGTLILVVSSKIQDEAFFVNVLHNQNSVASNIGQHWVITFMNTL